MFRISRWVSLFHELFKTVIAVGVANLRNETYLQIVSVNILRGIFASLDSIRSCGALISKAPKRHYETQNLALPPDHGID